MTTAIKKKKKKKVAKRLTPKEGEDVVATVATVGSSSDPVVLNVESADSETKASKKKTVKKKSKKKAAKKKSKKKAPKKTEEKKKGSGKNEPESVHDVIKSIAARDRKTVVIYEGAMDNAPVYPTRFLKLDKLIGKSPCVGGCIIEIYGLEDSGKSSFAAALAADIQSQAPKEKNVVVILNFEGPGSYPWWRILRLNTKESGKDLCFVHLRPKNLEQGMSDLIRLVKTGRVCAAVIDSVFAAGSKASEEMVESWGQVEGKATDPAGVCVEARQWSKAWNATKITFMDYDVCVIAVNQAREDMNQGPRGKKGAWNLPKKITSSRGRSLKFFAWIRLELTGMALKDDKGELIKDKDGRRIKIRIIKNKTTGEDRGTVFYNLVRGVGFDQIAEIIELGIEAGVITGGGGGYYTLGGKKIHGKANLRKIIEDHPQIKGLLLKRIEQYLSKLEVEPIDFSSIDEDEDD